MQIASTTTHAAGSPSPAGPNGTPTPRALRLVTRMDEERAIARSVEPAPRVAPVIAPATPRWVEAEPDYRSPTPVERARLLRAAYEASITDAEQRLLIAELMAHYRAWCLRHGKGDPFAALARG